MEKIRLHILGSSGFIGSFVCEHLNKNHEITKDSFCDVLVNCAGFSKMYEGNKNPDKMRKIEYSILEKINSIKFDRIIHLSSIYVSLYDNIYCQIKREIENTIFHRYLNSTILRLGGVIGGGLNKGVVFDIMNDGELFVSANSEFNLISVEDVSNVIEHLIKNPIYGIINVGASSTIKVSRIAELFQKNPKYGSRECCIVMDIERLNSFYSTRTSEEYVKKFIYQDNENR